MYRVVANMPTTIGILHVEIAATSVLQSKTFNGIHYFNTSISLRLLFKD